MMAKKRTEAAKTRNNTNVNDRNGVTESVGQNAATNSITNQLNIAYQTAPIFDNSVSDVYQPKSTAGGCWGASVHRLSVCDWSSDAFKWSKKKIKKMQQTVDGGEQQNPFRSRYSGVSY